MPKASTEKKRLTAAEAITGCEMACAVDAARTASQAKIWNSMKNATTRGFM